MRGLRLNEMHEWLCRSVTRRLRTIAAVFLPGLLALAVPAHAQTWPAKPITIVTPYSAGGPLDISARTLAVPLAKQLGVSVVVANKSGAGGNIGAGQVANSDPDGYTLLMGATPTNAINPSLLGVPYDPIGDFRFITLLVQVPNVLVVNAEFPANSVQELIAKAKERPESVIYGGTLGSPGHLAGEMFMSMTDTKMVFVPYPGSAPAVVDLIAGRVHLMFDNLASALPQIKSGKVRPLAVTTASRSEFLPNVPTLDESGLKGFNMSTWWGVMAPGKTPDSVVQRLSTEILKAMKTPEMQEHLNKLGSLQVEAQTPEQFRAFVASELDLYTKLVKRIKTKPQ